jgi:hypothetical protein
MLTTRRRSRSVCRRGRDDGDESRGGAPADGVGAPGDVEDVNLRQEKTP